MFIKDINSFKKAGPDRGGLLLPLYDKTGNFIKQFVPKIFFLEKKKHNKTEVEKAQRGCFLGKKKKNRSVNKMKDAGGGTPRDICERHIAS